jgi:hypothetical protein
MNYLYDNLVPLRVTPNKEKSITITYTEINNVIYFGIVLWFISVVLANCIYQFSKRIFLLPTTAKGRKKEENEIKNEEEEIKEEYEEEEEVDENQTPRVAPSGRASPRESPSSPIFSIEPNPPTSPAKNPYSNPYPIPQSYLHAYNPAYKRIHPRPSGYEQDYDDSIKILKPKIIKNINNNPNNNNGNCKKISYYLIVIPMTYVLKFITFFTSMFTNGVHDAGSKLIGYMLMALFFYWIGTVMFSNLSTSPIPIVKVETIIPDIKSVVLLKEDDSTTLLKYGMSLMLRKIGYT